MTSSELAVYIALMLCIWGVYWLFTHTKHKKSLVKLQESVESGLIEPASLHPVIDPNICLGCGACTRACPEGDILGLIHGKAELVEPTNCIGHGACKAACPVDAITLVFGSERRGMDIPVLAPNFETNVPGLFIAGELGGMGLIRNAIEQGVQAATEIKKVAGSKHRASVDVLIVGAGPAGIGAALQAKKLGLKYKVIEQDSLGGAVSHFPRKKLVMTAPVDLPIIGKARFKETTKEALLEFWEDVIAQAQLEIHFGERLEDAELMVTGGFTATTTQGTFTARCILLCMGRRGTPRKLNVKGEERSKVVYRLVDPAQYRNQHVLVVGGGDSALEAATSIAEEPGTYVTLSYRGEAFSRAKAKNRQKVEFFVEKNLMQVKLESQVLSIDDDTVTLVQKGEQLCIDNDAVIVCAGGVLPTPFLKKLGINIETKHGEA